LSSADPQQIHDQLSSPLKIGERGLRDLPDRQQTLHATVAWSYDLLSAPAQATLRGAGTFLGGFTPAALGAVTGRPAGTELAELREASLVRRQADTGRSPWGSPPPSTSPRRSTDTTERRYAGCIRSSKV
jgi:predicted ATPase